MYIGWDTIITIGSALTAIGVMVGCVLKVHKWFLEQKEVAKQQEEQKHHHDDDVRSLKEENRIMCFALSACLDGLQQLGANHTVPLAKEKLDEYLNQKAHE